MLEFDKSGMLINLKDKLDHFLVPDLVEVPITDFLESKTGVCELLFRRFRNKKIAIRSSAPNEDGENASFAGAYESFLNVNVSDPSCVQEKIEAVMHSYELHGLDIKQCKVFAQEMVQNVAISGVVFSRDLDRGAPYYMVNYDDVSGETDTVTSGSGEHSNKLLCVYRKKVGQLRSNRFRKLLVSLQELEKYFKKTTLDVEFVIDNSDRIFLLQVRELATKSNWNFTDDESVGIELEKANKQLKFFFDL